MLRDPHRRQELSQTGSGPGETYNERSSITVAGSEGNRNTPAPGSLATRLNKTNDLVVVQVLLVYNNDLMFKTGDSIARAMNR
jgi:hypothetical protein